MTYTTLIQPAELRALLASDAAVQVFDCSFDLMNPAAGAAQYSEAHIPGALHAHLDQALSAKGSPTAASGGRHPLPSRESFAAWLGSVGMTPATQAVVYDRQGANYCGRLWWMLKWLGHDAVAVLDGGLQAWQADGGEVTADLPSPRTPSSFPVLDALVSLVSADSVLHGLGDASQVVLDARATPRFKGEVEPIDPVAGHIPGALNRPFAQNIGADGRFKPAEVLRAEFEKLLGTRDPARVVHHCGSGVSAVPNILAMQLAGLGTTDLFAGSWSEWVSDPTRPVAQG